jgi:hypothetical protein
MLRKNKRGDLTAGEVMGIILAGAVMFLLIFLLYNLIYPDEDKSEKTSESYLDSLKVAISEADSGGKGEFSIWQNLEDSDFYFVYFGSKTNTNYEPSSLTFTYLNSKISKNVVCICYAINKATFCDKCMELDLPTNLPEGWAKPKGVRYSIEKVGGAYNFNEI